MYYTSHLCASPSLGAVVERLQRARRAFLCPSRSDLSLAFSRTRASGAVAPCMSSACIGASGRPAEQACARERRSLSQIRRAREGARASEPDALDDDERSCAMEVLCKGFAMSYTSRPSSSTSLRVHLERPRLVPPRPLSSFQPRSRRPHFFLVRTSLAIFSSASRASDSGRRCSASIAAWL